MLTKRRSVWRLQSKREAQLTAHDIRINQIPLVIAHDAPSASMVHFHAALEPAARKLAAEPHVPRDNRRCRRQRW